MVIPFRRDYKANLNFSQVDKWCGKGKFTTHFMNALSAYFPPGERFFLDSVMAFRNDLKNDVVLNKKINGFVGQEVMHGRMHDQYDEALALAGYPARQLEKLVECALKVLAKNTDPEFQLALTVAAEHYTATMANFILESDTLDYSDPSYQWLWKVHAIEEIEHRSVSFDVYDAIGGSYKQRMIAYLITSAVLFPVFVATQIAYIIKDQDVSVLSKKEWIKFGAVFSSLTRSIGPELLKFLNPTYHPDDMQISEKYEVTRHEIFGAPS